MDSTRRSDPDPQTISVQIDEVNFTTPRLFYDIHPELMCNSVDVIHPEVNEGVRAGVPGVFREEKTSRTTLSSYRREYGQARFKCVLPFLFIAKPGEPGQSPTGV